MMTKNSKIANNLKAAREAKKLTQAQVAQELSYQQCTISKYESGDRAPNYDTLSEFSRLYDVNISYFFGE